ncbi:MAG TPA: TetR/AcrR family transcriptional regulator [Roseiflexaceae bacterium]|nr:TetR/AcrR family transcriptional regulator [Roseiflexaceae bacterium]
MQHEKPTRRARAQHEKQQRIIAAAAALFQEQGFDATTIEQIAAQADVAKGTIFLYAESKLHLLLLIYENDLEQRVVEALAAIDSDAPVVESLMALFAPFFALYAQNIELARRFVHAQLFLPADQPTPALTVLLGGLTARIRDWQASGRVAGDVDAMLAAQTIFAIYFSVLAAWLGGRLPETMRDAQLSAALTLLWRGLSINQ